MPLHKVESSNPSDKKMKQTKIRFPSKIVYASADEMYAELVCMDGFSINACANSNIVRGAIEMKGFRPYSKPRTIQEKIVSVYDNKVNETKCELQSGLEKGERYSISFDEYTSSGNRRFLTINVHTASKNTINLGMVRVHGSQNFESLLKLVADRLIEFGLDLRHIVAVTTDGASIMVKLGQNIDPLHQTCLAHALHLAVCDVIYVKPKKTDADGEEVEIDWVDVEFEEVFGEYEGTSGPDSDFGESEEEDRLSRIPEFQESIPARHGRVSSQLKAKQVTLKSKYKEPIKKVREISKKFKRSPTLNDNLQKEIVNVQGREKKLKLDCKTRWNSMRSMLATYMEVHQVVIQVWNAFGKQWLICKMHITVKGLSKRGYCGGRG